MYTCSAGKVVSQIWELAHNRKIITRKVIINQNHTIGSQEQIIAIFHQLLCLQNAVPGGVIVSWWLCSWPLSHITIRTIIVKHKMQGITVVPFQTILLNRLAQTFDLSHEKSNQNNEVPPWSTGENSQWAAQFQLNVLDCIQYKSFMATYLNSKTNHPSVQLQQNISACCFPV